jgi:hypothetical protein
MIGAGGDRHWRSAVIFMFSMLSAYFDIPDLNKDYLPAAETSHCQGDV